MSKTAGISVAVSRAFNGFSAIVEAPYHGVRATYGATTIQHQFFPLIRDVMLGLTARKLRPFAAAIHFQKTMRSKKSLCI